MRLLHVYSLIKTLGQSVAGIEKEALLYVTVKETPFPVEYVRNIPAKTELWKFFQHRVSISAEITLELFINGEWRPLRLNRLTLLFIGPERSYGVKGELVKDSPLIKLPAQRICFIVDDNRLSECFLYENAPTVYPRVFSRR